MIRKCWLTVVDAKYELSQNSKARLDFTLPIKLNAFEAHKKIHSKSLEYEDILYFHL